MVESTAFQAVGRGSDSRLPLQNYESARVSHAGDQRLSTGYQQAILEVGDPQTFSTVRGAIEAAFSTQRVAEFSEVD